MSCLNYNIEKQRNKELMRILACQCANLIEHKVAFYEESDGYGGKIYHFIDNEQAKRRGIKVLQVFSPGDDLQLRGKSGKRGSKVSADTKGVSQPASDKPGVERKAK